MKKILFGLIFLLLVLITVIAVNTATYKSKQLVTKGAAKNNYAVDSAELKHLSGAVQIATVSYDDTSKVNYATLDTFVGFLHNQYPLVFEKLEDTLIGGHNILLKWKGKNETAKPVIFYAHMDVVPIEETTAAEWTHKPFSGDIDDTCIWGRGTLDDKGSLISIFEALDRLLQKGFTPGRTIYFAFGSDEEIGGNSGAASIAAYLEKQNVKFEFYVDEGGMVSEGMVPNIKQAVALIGTAEKGYVTMQLSVNMPGGHSSRPPRESAVDVLVAALKKIHDNPEQRRIVAPVSGFIEYVGPEMPMPLRAVFANRWLFKPLILNQYEKSAEGYALLRTTGVTTVINAGVKENVVPSLVTAQANFRIITGETVQQVIDRVKGIINDNRVQIKTAEVYEPSRNSGYGSYGFQLIQKTAADVFPDAIVAPFLMLGSTDSKHFQNLTENTYRFFPTRMDKNMVGSIHGINERIRISGYMETIAFYQNIFTNLH